MAIYDLTCADGHRFEVIQSFTAPLPACACGEPTRKLPSRVALSGDTGSLPPPAEYMPQTWRGTFNGNREFVAEQRRVAERRRALEDRHPELAGDRRPIVAHEGRFEQTPLRAGDPLPTTHSHPQTHSHPHPH